VVFIINTGTGINTDIERLVDGEERRHSVRDGLLSYFLAVHREDTGAGFGHAGPVVFKIKHDGVFAGGERLCAFPAKSFESKEVVSEDCLALEQIKSVATKTPAKRVKHSLSAARGNFHLRSDGEGFAD